MAATDMAPDSTLIRLCHNSVLFSNDISSRISGAGHFHSGKLRTAIVGTNSDMVPPCTIGNLQEDKTFILLLITSSLNVADNSKDEIQLCIYFSY
jgi:hypothetical protein